MKNEFFINNRKKLQESIKDNSILILFAGVAPQRSADQSYIFTPNRNFYYITGIDRDQAIYVLAKSDENIREYLFIEEGNPVLEKWIGKRMTKDEAKEASGLDNIKFLTEFEGLLHQEITGNSLEKVYLDLEKRSYDSIPTRAQLFSQDIIKKYPQASIKNIYNDVAKIRVKKEQVEIDKMRRAIEITGEGIKSLMVNCEAGLFEYQVEAYFDFTIKNLGAKNKAFNTIAAAGKNATVLHYEDNNCQLSDGELILFDLGAEFQHYCADISRTIPVNGKFTPRQKDVYNVVLKALDEVTKRVRPGVTFTELNEYTKKILAQGCIELGIIKDEGELSKYYYHGVGHFLGLDTHDVGARNAKLEAGMVITIEPGLYIDEEAIGVRIEDDVLVTENGHENLSKDIIRTVEDIEKFMAKR
ncbi:aminopeptidase P N-terminal domain-containing protein [Alkalicella caledoniensis]|uniref:Xaa-Pro aminopeptidase n=1 Tax=Alkalicella caledoniensis TaxID=2731377 RepID=A0A7G9W7F1_ALKCA|nr:aminopeptidase P N-terminal domain-containing protein [Alkalicella caledoniensis]QNO14613.1 aminopeptidase P N-terminal domain-containing protein [Alkalicella caledoniensis]